MFDREKGKSRLRSGGRIGLLTVIVGTIIVSLFKALFPHTDPGEMLAVAAIISIIVAAGLNHIWTRRRERREKK